MDLSNDEELLKSCISLAVNDSVIIGYVVNRVRQEGNFDPKVDKTPLITMEIEMADSTFGLPTCKGNLRISIINSTVKSEHKKISKLIGARIKKLFDDIEGKDNINNEGEVKSYYPKIRMIERQNGFFMPTEIDNITRYIQNFQFIVGKQ